MSIIIDRAFTAEAVEKKLYNIKAFSSLSKTGLKFGSIERRLLMKEFPTGEKLYIQYPGKESARDKSPRPWDFRPKMQLPNGEWLKDLSFKDVWDDLYSLRDVNSDLSYIATLFCRIAYMLDTKLTKRTLRYEDIDQDGNVVNTGEITLSWYEYDPQQDIIEGAYISAEALRGVSLLPCLAYNDYLAQNEDCKYYYRDEVENNKKWDGKIGRKNTLLTHVAVIAFMKDKISFSHIMDMFQRGRGVAPIQEKYLEELTGGRIVK